MKTFKWIAAASLAFVFIACCPCRKNKSALIPFTGTEWKLAQLYGEGVESNNYRVTFAADGSLNGIAECNNFAGTFTQNVHQIKVSENLVSTRMFCVDNQQREDKFLKMLSQVDTYSIDGMRLMLIRNGSVLAIFNPVGEYQVINPKKRK